MQLLLSGPTGFVGQEILTQALLHPHITSITALSRKPLPAPFHTNPRIKTVIVEDFESYSPSVLSQLKDVDVCIWTIGAKSTDPGVTRKITIDYTMAAAKAFAKLGEERGKKFRFVFTSGILAVKDPKEKVWIYAEARKVAGEAETQLLAFFKKNEKNFEGYITRPSAVLTKDRSVKNWVMGFVRSIRVDDLAAASIDIALNGNEKEVLENAELSKRGRELLKGQ